MTKPTRKTGTLTIRYARTDTTPAKYRDAGDGIAWSDPSDDGCYTVTGRQTTLTEHVRRALASNDLNDYTIAADPK